MTQILRARRLLTEQGWLADHQLRMEAGVITAIEPVPVGVTARDAEAYAARTKRLVPGIW